VDDRIRTGDRLDHNNEIAPTVSMIYVRGDPMGKATQAAGLSVVAALLLAFAVFFTSAASAAPTPRPGEYYGSQNGTVVEFSLVKSHGVIKGHYAGRAVSFPSSDPPSCQAQSTEARFIVGNYRQFLFEVRDGRITLLKKPKQHDVFGLSGSFRGRSKASGKIEERLAGGVRCLTGWTAERVSRPTFAKTGTWVGKGDELGVEFKVSAGGRLATDFNFTLANPIRTPTGECSGPFGLGGSWFIPPNGSSFSDFGEAEGTGWGFENLSFPSATAAMGSFKGTGECQFAPIAWTAQPSG
jgi:hypothetical protein